MNHSIYSKSGHLSSPNGNQTSPDSRHHYRSDTVSSRSPGVKPADMSIVLHQDKKVSASRPSKALVRAMSPTESSKARVRGRESLDLSAKVISQVSMPRVTSPNSNLEVKVQSPLFRNPNPQRFSTADSFNRSRTEPLVLQPINAPRRHADSSPYSETCHSPSLDFSMAVDVQTGSAPSASASASASSAFSSASVSVNRLRSPGQLSSPPHVQEFYKSLHDPSVQSEPLSVFRSESSILSARELFPNEERERERERQLDARERELVLSTIRASEELAKERAAVEKERLRLIQATKRLKDLQDAQVVSAAQEPSATTADANTDPQRLETKTTSTPVAREDTDIANESRAAVSETASDSGKKKKSSIKRVFSALFSFSNGKEPDNKTKVNGKMTDAESPSFRLNDKSRPIQDASPVRGPVVAPKQMPVVDPTLAVDQTAAKGIAVTQQEKQVEREDVMTAQVQDNRGRGEAFSPIESSALNAEDEVESLFLSESVSKRWPIGRHQDEADPEGSPADSTSSSHSSIVSNWSPDPSRSPSPTAQHLNSSATVISATNTTPIPPTEIPSNRLAFEPRGLSSINQRHRSLSGDLIEPDDQTVDLDVHSFLVRHHRHPGVKDEESAGPLETPSETSQAGRTRKRLSNVDLQSFDESFKALRTRRLAAAKSNATTRSHVASDNHAINGVIHSSRTDEGAETSSCSASEEKIPHLLLHHVHKPPDMPSNQVLLGDCVPHDKPDIRCNSLKEGSAEDLESVSSLGQSDWEMPSGRSGDSAHVDSMRPSSRVQRRRPLRRGGGVVATPSAGTARSTTLLSRLAKDVDSKYEAVAEADLSGPCEPSAVIPQAQPRDYVSAPQDATALSQNSSTVVIAAEDKDRKQVPKDGYSESATLLSTDDFPKQIEKKRHASSVNRSTIVNSKLKEFVRIMNITSDDRSLNLNEGRDLSSKTFTAKPLSKDTKAAIIRSVTAAREPVTELIGGESQSQKSPQAATPPGPLRETTSAGRDSPEELRPPRPVPTSPSEVADLQRKRDYMMKHMSTSQVTELLRTVKINPAEYGYKKDAMIAGVTRSMQSRLFQLIEKKLSSSPARLRPQALSDPPSPSISPARTPVDLHVSIDSYDSEEKGRLRGRSHSEVDLMDGGGGGGGGGGSCFDAGINRRLSRSSDCEDESVSAGSRHSSASRSSRGSPGSMSSGSKRSRRRRYARTASSDKVKEQRDYMKQHLSTAEVIELLREVQVNPAHFQYRKEAMIDGVTECLSKEQSDVIGQRLQGHAAAVRSPPAALYSNVRLSPSAGRVVSMNDLVFRNNERRVEFSLLMSADK